MGVLRLNDFEQAVLDKLIAGDHDILATLRTQAERARLVSREYTGTGFHCSFEVPADVPPVSAANDFEIGDVDASVEGLEHGAGFLLFVRNGRMTMLEGYSYEEEWPGDVRNFRLTYRRDPRELSF